MQRVALLIGAALVAAGLIAGFGISVHSAGQDCGSAFRERGGLEVDQLSDSMLGKPDSSDCDAARSSARTLPVVLLVLGGVSLVGAPLLVQRDRTNSGREPSTLP